jgi:hypothetical protein
MNDLAVTPRSIGYLSVMKLLKEVASHCIVDAEKNNHADGLGGRIHKDDLENLLAKYRAKWTDLYQGYDHDLIISLYNNAAVRTDELKDNYKLTDYGDQCITPRRWFK